MNWVHEIATTTDLIYVSGFYCMFPTLLLPYSHRLFRYKLSFFFLLAFALFIAFIGYNLYDEELERDEKLKLLVSLGPVTFCALYRLFDFMMINFNNRHLHFYVRWNLMPHDPESDKSTSLDYLFQFILMSSMFIPTLLGELILP